MAYSKYKREIPIIIYTMGKVGSSSLEASIDGAIHLHSLYGNPPNPPNYALNNVSIAQKIKHKIRDVIKIFALKRAKKIKIITVIRPPMDRNISMFFQALPFWMSTAQSDFGGKRIVSPRAEGFDTLHEVFNRSFNHDYPNTWFHEEIERFSGIDVYSKPFNKADGYIKFSKGKYELLVLECSKIKELGSTIADFVGSEITNDGARINDASNKWYASVYKEFKDTYIPSSEVKDAVYYSKFYTHFYD